MRLVVTVYCTVNAAACNCMDGWMDGWACVCVCVCVCVCACMCVCLCCVGFLFLWVFYLFLCVCLCLCACSYQSLSQQSSRVKMDSDDDDDDGEEDEEEVKDRCAFNQFKLYMLSCCSTDLAKYNVQMHKTKNTQIQNSNTLYTHTKPSCLLL